VSEYSYGILACFFSIKPDNFLIGVEKDSTQVDRSFLKKENMVFVC
jgi:hypothetical protein